MGHLSKSLRIYIISIVGFVDLRWKSNAEKGILLQRSPHKSMKVLETNSEITQKEIRAEAELTRMKIREGTETTRQEIQKSIETTQRDLKVRQLQKIQAEIRVLLRGKRNRATKKQLKQFQIEEKQLIVELNPPKDKRQPSPPWPKPPVPWYPQLHLSPRGIESAKQSIFNVLRAFGIALVFSSPVITKAYFPKTFVIIFLVVLLIYGIYELRSS